MAVPSQLRQPANPDENLDSRVGLSTWFDACPVPMFVTALDRDRVLTINRRASEVLVISKDQAIARPVASFYSDPSELEHVVSAIESTGHLDDVRLLLRRADGLPLWVVASGRRVSWRGERAIHWAFADITRQTAVEQALATSEQRLVAQSRALTSLMERSAEGTDRFDGQLGEILRTAAETLQVERMSLWRFDRTRREISCVSLFHRSSARYESGARIPREQCPEYFAALETERVIAAHDARRDRRTRGFTESYLMPYGVGAMLDMPLRQSGETLGVLCAEHVGEARTWTVDEQNFALSVTNLIAVEVAHEERRDTVERLARSEARANLIVDTAHDAFIGIDETGRITNWNTQAAVTFGWTSAEVLGRKLAETIIPPALRQAHLEGLRRFYATGEAPVLNRRLELTAIHRSGREFPIELTITSPIRGENGFFFGAFLRDISDRQERDEQLRVARDAAERSRDSLDRELASAARMQQLLLPTSLPDDPGARFVAHYRTSRHAGGDYYDVVPVGPHRFTIIVADVAGHGASAAIVMAMIRAVLHAHDRTPDDPPALLHHLNRHFRYLWSSTMFTTAIVAVLDTERRTLRISSAGHQAPLLVRGTSVSELPIANAPLLFWNELGEVPCLEQTLQAGDRLIFYTDGVTDRRNAAEALFDLPRLIRKLASTCDSDAVAMVGRVVQELDAFGEQTEPDDDQTLLAVEIG